MSRDLVRVAVSVVAIASGAAAQELALDGGGGETWGSTRRIAGTIASGTCDRVTLLTPRGVVSAAIAGQRFTADVPLAEGWNDVAALCLVGDEPRSASAPQRWHQRAPDPPRAEIRATADAHGLHLDASASAPAAGFPVPLLSMRWFDAPANPTRLIDAAAGMRLDLPVPRQDGRYRVSLQVVDGLGREDTASVVIAVTAGRATVLDGRSAPSWMADAVVYGVAPGLLGGFDGVVARLDALVALGVNTIWLAPVTDAPDGDFGYAMRDTQAVRTSLGGEGGLRALIAAAHRRGLRVLLDLVVNHLSDQSPYARDVAAHGPGSPYHGLFQHGPDGGFVHYFDWGNLLNLDYGNPEVRALTLAACRRWVREFGIDGFRVDAAWTVRERTPAFWPTWRAELKRLDPELLLLAEASARDPYYRANGFDAAYDWTDRLGEWAWHAAFQDTAHTAAHLRAAIGTGDGRVFRFLANNDTGRRFISRYGAARTRVAAAMLLTLPGIPGLWLGDETGAAFEPYGAAPALDEQDPNGLRPYYARLLQLRRTHAALRSEALTWIDVGTSETVMGYLRSGGRQDDGVLVLLNYGAASQRVALAGLSNDSRPAIDLMSGEPVALDANLVLPGHGVRLLGLPRAE